MTLVTPLFVVQEMSQQSKRGSGSLRLWPGTVQTALTCNPSLDWGW